MTEILHVDTEFLMAMPDSYHGSSHAPAPRPGKGPSSAPAF